MTIGRNELYRTIAIAADDAQSGGGQAKSLGTRAATTIPQDANQRWSLEFAGLHNAEVAVLHAPAETVYMPLSEPLRSGPYPEECLTGCLRQWLTLPNCSASAIHR